MIQDVVLSFTLLCSGKCVQYGLTFFFPTNIGVCLSCLSPDILSPKIIMTHLASGHTTCVIKYRYVFREQQTNCVHRCSFLCCCFLLCILLDFGLNGAFAPLYAIVGWKYCSLFLANPHTFPNLHQNHGVLSIGPSTPCLSLRKHTGNRLAGFSEWHWQANYKISPCRWYIRPGTYYGHRQPCTLDFASVCDSQPQKVTWLR